MIPHASAKTEEEESIVSFDYEKAKEVKWYDKILLNRPLKVILALILVSALVPVLLYQFIFYESATRAPPDGFSMGSCFVDRPSRIPCGIGNVSQSECDGNCCYDLVKNSCFHRLPSRYSYLVPSLNWTEKDDLRPRFPNVPFKSQPSVPFIRLSVDEITSSHLSLTFYDSQNMSLSGSRIEEKSYTYRILSPELNIIVYANGNDSIFNTMNGPIIASDNIWEIAFKLTKQSMYGLGELPLEPGTVKVIYSYEGGFSTTPLIFARTHKSYHGLLIDINTPTEVTVGADNQLIVRSITKTGLKFHLFTGPEPKDIMRDAMSIIGTQKRLDYWMLGAHVCSELASSDDEALTLLNTFITEATRSRVPYESHCGIRPLVFDTETVTSTVVVNGARAVTNARKKFVPHLSPYIRYTYVEKEIVPDNSTASNETTSCTDIVCEFKHMIIGAPPNSGNVTLYIGSAHEQSVVYPDYTNDDATDLLDKLWVYDVVLSGAVLENTWPLDESVKAHNETYLELPYFNKNFEEVFDKTPQWNAIMPQGDYYLYDHNEYGSQFMDALWAKFNQTPVMPTWSSSPWMRGDAIVNRQEVPTSWLSLRRELVGAALGGVSGHWLWSTPICGDTENFNSTTHANLCVKWYMAGTYFPLIKIHAKSVRRDPLAYEGTHQTLIMNALTRRMSLMPYFHTVLQEGPLLRPMFYQFPFSEQLVDSSSQFSVGDDMLIAPNLLPSQSHVHVRMPPGVWYDMWSGLRVDGEEGQYVTMATTEADFVTLVRGGAIVPLQRTVMDTADLTRRNSDFTLIVATNRANVTNSTNSEETVETDYAKGYLRMALNMTVHFTVQENQLIITSEGDDFNSFCGGTLAVWASTIRIIDIYGLPAELNNFDNHRNVNIMMGINLCNLRTQERIVQALV